MATTATNKQPLLIDRIFHYVVDTNNTTTATLGVTGSNTAALLVNAISSDGAIVEEIYSIARGGPDATAEKINLYLSTTDDYLRPGEGKIVGQFISGTAEAEVTRWTNAPKILAPVPLVSDGAVTTPTGEAVQLRALYVPKGYALWAARQSTVVLADGPYVGCQGGWY